MVRSKDEIIKMLTEKMGEDTSDEALAILEDVTDTISDYEAKTADATDWKTKYENNDKEWRDRYRERFMTGSDDSDEDIPDEPEDKKYTFDELFTTG